MGNNSVGYPCAWSDEKTDNPNFEGPKYRYTLWRFTDEIIDERYSGYDINSQYILEDISLGELSVVNFCLCNPSTADEDELDPTLTRCWNYARGWGYDAMVVTNAFAYRATSPDNMKEADDPVGPDNDYWITRIAELAHLVVGGWGTNGTHRGRHTEMMKLLRNHEPHALTTTKDGYPGHPLYLKKEAKPELLNPRDCSEANRDLHI